MTIEEVKDGDVLVVKINGKIDASTGDKFQDAILQAFRKCSNVVVDFSQTLFISSAGLRGLLIGQKTASAKGGSLVIRGAGQPLMQIFQTTGFDKMLTIE